MKARERQKSQFSNSLVNWKKFGSRTKANIWISRFFIFFPELEKIEKSSYSNIQKSKFSISLWKTWKYSLRPTFKTPKSAFTDELGKVISYILSSK